MKETYFLFLGFGLVSQAVLCFAVISLLDGGTFTSNRNIEKAEVDSFIGSNLEENGSSVCKQPGLKELLRNVKNICDSSAYTSKWKSGGSRIKKLKKEITEVREKKILIEEKGEDASTKDKEADKSDNDSVKKTEGEVPEDVLGKDSMLNIDPGIQEVEDDVVKPYVVVAVPRLPPQGKPEQLKEQLKSEVSQEKQQLVNLTAEQQKEQHFPANTSEKEIQTEGLTPGVDFGTTENSVGEELLEPASKEDDIVSFSQWAEMQQTDNVPPVKEQEKQDQTQTIAKPAPLKATGIKLTKNFASPDCTAKILAGNPESQGSGNVISNSRDEYILNKCTDKAWFVVELCESIKALKIQIANFELYSSSPKVFRVYIGNIYPGREKDWVEFGTFTYEDERSIQQFTNEEGVLGKYAKVEVLSHHGTEHYCPITLFRVYGISEIDLISDDNDDDHDDDDHQEQGTPEEKGPENPLVKSVKTISDAVVTAVKNIVFKNPQNTGSSNSSLHGSSMRHVLKTGSAQLSLPRINTLSFLLATQYDIIRSYLYTMSVRNVLLNNCHEYGIDLHSPVHGIHQSWRWLQFLQLVHGDDFILALCNVLSIELGLSELAPTLIAANKTVAAPVNMTTVVNMSSTTPYTPDDLEQISASAKQPNIETIISQPVKNITIRPDVEKNSEFLDTGNGDLKTTGNQGRETTWQKLSNRIRSLERNVSLSTGFLEELSLKYIKQIDELNTAVKVMSDSISILTKKEEACKVKYSSLEKQVEGLTAGLNILEGKITETQEELMSRHGLLVLLEICLLGLVLFWCSPSHTHKQRMIPGSSLRRLSLDTLKAEKQQLLSNNNKQRRKSIEVGGLTNGHIGSMIQPLELTKNQRRKKRRKEGRITSEHLKNVEEEMESEDDVYMTFSGRKGEQLITENRKRSNSWGESCDEINQLNKKKSRAGEEEEEEEEDDGYAEEFSKSKIWEKHVSDVIKSTRFLVSQVAGETERRDSRFCKSRSTSRSRELTPSSYEYPRIVESIKISNVYGVLDNSVHDVDTDLESETRLAGLTPTAVARKIHRSKSTSPSRQANQMKRQKVLFKNFRPEEADWLQ